MAGRELLGDGTQARMVGWENAVAGSKIEGVFGGWVSLNADYKPLAKITKADGEEILLKTPAILANALKKVEPGETVAIVYDKKGKTKAGKDCHFFQSIRVFESNGHSVAPAPPAMGVSAEDPYSVLATAYARVVQAVGPVRAKDIRSASEATIGKDPLKLAAFMLKAI